jgi:hypothetical protein
MAILVSSAIRLTAMYARSVTDQVERELFAQAEINYMSGATALVEAELALTRMSIYHKPGYNRNWSWDYQTEARIRRGTPSPKQYDWEDEPEFRRDADADEPEGRPELRTNGSVAIGIEHDEDPIPLPFVAGHLSYTRKDLLK